MCDHGTGSDCRSYFVLLTLHGYETHVIYNDVEMREYMYRDYILRNGELPLNAEARKLQDLECLFRKSGSLLSKFGFPMPGPVMSELDVERSRWCNDAEIE